MKVHSQGCMEAVTQYMRENITTLVGLIVATLFIQVIPLLNIVIFLTPSPNGGGHGTDVIICVSFIAVCWVCVLVLSGQLNKERM